ncbi:MAG: hypothetical protein ABSE73_08540 [Planctomycetota bacterium]
MRTGQSVQAAVAAQPKPVPDTQNAALLWRQAFEAAPKNDWIQKDKKNPHDPDTDWRDPSTCAPDSFVREFLKSHARAPELAVLPRRSARGLIALGEQGGSVTL